MTKKGKLLISLIILVSFFYTSCSNDDDGSNPTTPDPTPASILRNYFGTNINLDNLPNYANQDLPRYITKDNASDKTTSDEVAVLGRVLFYDKKLSTNNTIACASCHKQELGFTDDAIVSEGVNGVTGRHSMRLINSRYTEESRYFWDERATSLEDQSTQPIKDHAEMGFSGVNGAPDFNDLITKLSALDYYQVLFTEAFGSETVTEDRIKTAISQFVRSIQSYDSDYDVGRALVEESVDDFPTFTEKQNRGKRLFLTPPQFNAQGQRTGGGLGCGGCHRAPEYDIDPQSRNNGVISVANSEQEIDLTNTKSPAIRDIMDSRGRLHAPLMHTGSFTTFQQVLDHYNNITLNSNLDRRLMPGGRGQQLMLTDEERDAVEIFVRTLTGSSVYTDPKWSDPFIQ